ncbi:MULTISPECIES: hypothetical protein [unclassified Pseudomonas]|uniref:hypothetical protein n=1 Tax=unclassified Pseudomonas TaxID=196821 RepID=UPI000BA40050|nr:MULTISPECIES: hypothetical protein [unclassified Pseudomonas]MCE0965894.1 hypothetical protein [Pseudomonas sp. NMI4491_12]
MLKQPIDEFFLVQAIETKCVYDTSADSMSDEEKNMPVTLSNSTIISGITAVTVSHGTDLRVENSLVYGLEKGIEERDPVPALEGMGLPKETPPEYLLAALLSLKENANKTVEEKAAIVESSKLGAYLQHLANSSTVVSGIVQLSAHPYVDRVIEFLKSF